MDHLPGLLVPCFRFASTHGGTVDLEAAARAAGTLVLYIYPRTGTPGQPSPTGWDAIPGARGCTPQFARLTMVIRDAHIAKVFYPVLPPDRNAADVVAWLRERG